MTDDCAKVATTFIDDENSLMDALNDLSVALSDDEETGHDWNIPL